MQGGAYDDLHWYDYVSQTPTIKVPSGTEVPTSATRAVAMVPETWSSLHVVLFIMQNAGKGKLGAAFYAWVLADPSSSRQQDQAWGLARVGLERGPTACRVRLQVRGEPCSGRGVCPGGGTMPRKGTWLARRSALRSCCRG